MDAGVDREAARRRLTPLLERRTEANARFFGAEAERLATVVGHLRPVRLPGGAAAVRQPWRMACAWVTAALGDNARQPRSLVGIGAARWHAVARMITTGLHAPWTTSVGRLFDAVAALCSLGNEASYEGEADGLTRQGLRVLLPERVPPNDGGIAYGQAAIAAALTADASC